jgi:hypothetical protein
VRTLSKDSLSRDWGEDDAETEAFIALVGIADVAPAAAQVTFAAPSETRAAGDAVGRTRLGRGIAPFLDVPAQVI